MENIFKDSNTVITPALDNFYSNSFLVNGNPANENVMPTPQIGDYDDKTKEVKAAINKLNNISDISKSNVSNVQSKYTDPLADAKMFTFNPTYKGLNWDRYKSHSSFDKLGFDPFRDNEKLYNENSSIWSDVMRGVQGFGSITASSFINTAADLPKLLTGNWAPNTDAAKETERIMAETMSTRGTLGSSIINFGINAGFTVGIIGELIAEEALLAIGGIAGAAETGGGTAGAAAYLMALRANLAGAKLMSIPKTTGALLKAIKNLDNAVEAKQYFTQFAKGTADFFNPLRATTDLARNWKNLEGLGQTAKTAKSFGAFFKDIRDINRSFSEAKLEGGFVQNQMFEKLLSEAYANGKTPTTEEIDRIKDTSLTAGVMNQMINFPVIQYTNNITFGNLTRPLGKLIGSTQDSIKMLNKTVTVDITRKNVFQELTGGWKEAFKRGLNPRLMAKNTLNYFSANLAEGLQESFQEASAIAMEDYYTKQFHNNSSIVRETHDLSMLDSYGKGIGAQFSRQGAETFLSGFLMGGLMHKSVSGFKGAMRGLNESSNKIKDLYYSAVKPEKLQEFRDKREAAKIDREVKAAKLDKFRSDLIENQNDFYKDAGKMFSRDLEHMSAQEIIAAKAKQAQETGDKKFLMDLTDVSLHESIQNALYFEKFDLYLEHLNKILELDDQGLMDALGTTDAQAGRQRLEVSIERAKNIAQRSEKFAPNPFKYNDYQEDSLEYNEMVYMHKAYEDAKNAAIFTPYHFDRVLERLNSISKAFSSVDIVANGNATEFLHLFGADNILNEVDILAAEIQSLRDGTKENEKLADRKERQIEDLSELQKTIIEHKEYFKNLKENEDVDPKYFKNLKNAFIKYLGTYGKNNSRVLKSDKLEEAFELFHDYYRLNLDAELLSRNVAIVADPDFVRRESLRRYNAIKKVHQNRKDLIKRKWDSYLKKIGLNGVFQQLYEAGYAGDPDQMIRYSESNGKKSVTEFYRTKDFSRVTAADKEDIDKINKIFNEYEDIHGITKEKEEAAIKAEEEEAKKIEEEVAAAELAEKEEFLENFTPETKTKLVSGYEKYPKKDEETFEEYLETPEAKRIIAEQAEQAEPEEVTVIQALRNKLDKARSDEQAEYNAMTDPNDKAERKKIYEKYDIEITPIIRDIKIEIVSKNVSTTTKILEDLKANKGKAFASKIVSSPKYGIKNDVPGRSEEEVLSIAYHKAKLGIKGWSSLSEEDTDNEALVKAVEELLLSINIDINAKPEIIKEESEPAYEQIGNYFISKPKLYYDNREAISIINNKGKEMLYFINTDENGSIISLTPRNKRDQRIVNEKLLTAVEIKRNKYKYNNEVIKEIVDNESAYLNIKNEVPVLQIIENILNNGLTEELASSLNKLYANGKIELSELLAIQLWANNSARRITNFLNEDKYKDNPNLSQAWENMYIINELVSEKIEEIKNKPEPKAKAVKVKKVVEKTVDQLQRQRDKELKLIQEKRKELGIEFDPLDDLPESVVVTMERFESGAPMDPIAIDEASNWLYGKYKQITDMEFDPKRLLTLKQINQYTLALEKDIIALETYKTEQYGRDNIVQNKAPRSTDTTGREGSETIKDEEQPIEETGIDEPIRKRAKRVRKDKVDKATKKAKEQKSEVVSEEPQELVSTEEPIVPEEKPEFPISSQLKGKIIYFSPGLGKTRLVNLYPDQFVDMDVLLYEEFKNEPGFENATPENIGEVVFSMYGKVDDFNSIKEKHYDNAFKKAQSLAKQGKTVLTGSLAFISRADFSVKANNEDISAEQIRKKNPGITDKALNSYMDSLKNKENQNNVLLSVDKDSFIQFLMGNYDLLQYINQNISLEQLEELGALITEDMPEAIDAYIKKSDYLQARNLLFNNLQPGDTVIILNEKTGEQFKTKIIKMRDPDRYDIEYVKGEDTYLTRSNLKNLINVIPTQGVSKGIKIDDVDNSDAENNKTKVNDVATETERLKALLEKPFNMKNLFDDSEDPNNCNTKN